jgi:hypothetical protein
MPRTGSTTFQHVLSHLRPELSAAGILYPDLTPRSMHHEPHISHQHFGETLDGRRPRRERAELLGNLSGMLANCDSDIVLLSYEDFIQQQPRFRVPELLNAFFAKHGFTAEALVAAKPQSEHLNSIYSHRAQMMRERRDFACFARGYRCTARFEYDALIQPWIAAFQGRVRAVPVRDRRSDAPLIIRLLTELELDGRVAPLLRRRELSRVENRSPGPVAVEISRRLHAMRLHARLRVPPRNAMRFVERLARERGYDRERYNGVDARLRAEMDDRYRAENDRFARGVWGQSWDDIIAPEPAREVNDLAAGHIDPEIESAIAEIIIRAAQQFEVTARHSPFDHPINLAVETFENLQRRFGISRWRVV